MRSRDELKDGEISGDWERFSRNAGSGKEGGGVCTYVMHMAVGHPYNAGAHPYNAGDGVGRVFIDQWGGVLFFACLKASRRGASIVRTGVDVNWGGCRMLVQCILGLPDVYSFSY